MIATVSLAQGVEVIGIIGASTLLGLAVIWLSEHPRWSRKHDPVIETDHLIRMEAGADEHDPRHIMYRCVCSCGWGDPRWHVTEAHAYGAFAGQHPWSSDPDGASRV